MRRRHATAALLAVAALAAPVLQGCAADDVASVDVAQAVENTAAKQTARINGLITVEGFGLPTALSLPLSGVTSLSKPELDLRADVGGALSKVKPEIGSLPLELRVRGAVAYLKLPAIAQTFVPGGKPWATLDLQKLGVPMSFDGASLLRAARAAGKLKEVGSETIDGAKTTHVRGTVRLADQLRLLPARSRKAIERLAGKQADTAQPVDLWIDKDNIVRRERAVVSMDRNSIVPAGRVTAQVDYGDFGTPLATDLPAAKDTFDATSMISQFGFARDKTP